MDDLEVGLISNTPRNLSKKMRKRKHLDALLKFRSTKRHSNDIIRSSEDELFLPHQTSSNTKLRSSPYRRCWYYSKKIFSFGFICIFTIVCTGLISANIDLKNEVENLSSRINQIENKISNIQLNNISSTIKQIQIRLDFFDHWKYLLKDDLDKLQKNPHHSTESSEMINKLNNLNKKTEILIKNKMIEWQNQLASFRKEIQSSKVQELKLSLEQLTNLVQNSSEKTSVMLNEFQSNLDKLRTQIEECKCSKESVHLKPSVVDSDQLQQSIVTKPSQIIKSLTTTTTEKSNKQIKNLTDVEQIIN